MQSSRRLGLGIAILAAPSFAAAAPAPKNGLPQMDFSDPLTFIQLLWMAVIMIALYLLLSRWTLPRIGDVIEARAARVQADLDAAREAKAEAERATEALTQAIRQARETAQSTIAKAIDAAKAKAAAETEQLNARLDAQLAEAEARIGKARSKGMQSVAPVAGDLTADLVARLTGAAPDQNAVGHALTAAQA